MKHIVGVFQKMKPGVKLMAVWCFGVSCDGDIRGEGMMTCRGCTCTVLRVETDIALSSPSPRHYKTLPSTKWLLIAANLRIPIYTACIWKFN